MASTEGGVPGISLLYVDDEPELLGICKLYLEKNGEIIVNTAESADIALEMIRTHSYDAIVSDYQMPGMDGIAFLKYLKAGGDTTPFIIFTGKGREEVVIEALNEGADFYIQKGGKPKAQFAELSNKIRYAVSRRRAEESLRKSEEKYRHVIEASDEAIVVVQDRLLKLVNHQMVQLSGYLEQELQSMSFPTLFHPDDRAMIVGRCQDQANNGNAPANSAFRLIGKDGSTRWIEISVAEVDQDGSSATCIFLKDITGRRQAEEALKQSQLCLGEAMDLARLANWEFDVTTGTFTFNDRFYALYGTTAEIEGGYQMPAEVYTRKFVHPDEQDVVGNEVNKAIHTTDPDYLSQVEHRIIRRDGEIRHILVRFRITKDDNGRTVKTHGANQDISDRKRSEEALMRSESRYRALFLGAAEGILVADSEKRRLISANPAMCRILGYSNEEILSMGLEDIHPKEDFFRIMDEFAALVRREKTLAEDIPCRRKDGSVIFTDVVLSQGIIDGKMCNIGFFTDISERKEAVKLMRVNEERLRSITTTIPDLILMLDPQLIITYINRTITLDRRQLCGKSVFAFIPEAYHPAATACFKKVLETGKMSIYGTEHHFADGSTRYFESTVAPVIYDGEVNALVINARDITEKRYAEAALRESTKLYGMLAESSPDMIYLVDREGVIQYVNSRASQAFMRDPADLIGQRTGLIFPPEVARHYMEEINLVLRTKKPRFIETLEQYTKEERWISTRLIPITGSDSEVIQVLGISTDITERKQAEEALRESEEKYRGIFAAESDGIVVFDRDTGIIIDCNDAFPHLHGYRKDEVIGRLKTVISAGPEATRATTGEGKVHIPVIYHKRKDGSVFPVEINTNSMDLHGRDVIIATVRDITKRTQAEEALTLTSRKLTLLSSITRHDILNQLMALDGCLGLLHEEVPDPALQDYFMGIQTASTRISAMIHLTKEYEQIGIKTPAWQDSRALVANAAKEIPLGHTIVKNELPADTEVFADPLIRKVFYNLMDNAVRHGGKITTIRFFMEEGDDVHLIVCEDDGLGIPGEEKERIFERGFGKNTGMGLFLSREILAITGITICETGEPAKGARFEIIVPDGTLRHGGELHEST